MPDTEYAAGDVAAVLRAYHRRDEEAFNILTADDPGMLFACVGMAVDLAARAVRELAVVRAELAEIRLEDPSSPTFDDILQRVIEHHRGPA